jgi:hypothetical protein
MGYNSRRTNTDKFIINELVVQLGCYLVILNRVLSNGDLGINSDYYVIEATH